MSAARRSQSAIKLALLLLAFAPQAGATTRTAWRSGGSDPGCTLEGNYEDGQPHFYCSKTGAQCTKSCVLHSKDMGTM